MPWAGWVATGALAIGAGVAGVVALESVASLRDAKRSGPVSSTDLDAMSSRAKNWALVSDVCTAGAIVAGAVSLYFTLRAAPRGEVALGVVPGGLRVRGSF